MKHDSSRHLILSFSQFAFALVTLSTWSIICHAQDLDNVTVRGRVMDQNGAVITGASVAAILVRSGAIRSTTTNVEGRFRLIQLEPGTYLLRASNNGFAPQEMPRVTTLAGQTIEIDLPCPVPLVAGAYTLKLDLVDQHVCWFEERGSQPLLFSFQVVAKAG